MTISNSNIAANNVPKHIAIIMDGNGRWAKKQGAKRLIGHNQGVNTVREITEESARLGVKHLTLYTFSTENWNRPKMEINALMKLLVKSIEKETPRLMKNNIRLDAIGNLEHLPEKTLNTIKACINKTKNNTGMDLILALSYSGRKDIVNAVKNIAKEIKSGTLNPEDINDELFAQKLNTGYYPDPELLIRTSGEYRLSNFLLWELAYSEFYFTDVLWPDFTKKDLQLAILTYQNRERRFGKTSQQLI